MTNGMKQTMRLTRWGAGVTSMAMARLEDANLVTGRGAFLDDFDPLPGTLVAAVVRSPHAHAKITSVDLSRALAHPGVAAVIGPDEVRAALKPFPLSLRAPMDYDGWSESSAPTDYF